jgi:hypothetical protein
MSVIALRTEDVHAAAAAPVPGRTEAYVELEKVTVTYGRGDATVRALDERICVSPSATSSLWSARAAAGSRRSSS